MKTEQIIVRTRREAPEPIEGREIFYPKFNGVFMRFIAKGGKWKPACDGSYRMDVTGFIRRVPHWVAMGGYTERQYTNWLSSQGFAV